MRMCRAGCGRVATAFLIYQPNDEIIHNAPADVIPMCKADMDPTHDRIAKRDPGALFWTFTASPSQDGIGPGDYVAAQL
jgi:hypothetical protein